VRGKERTNVHTVTRLGPFNTTKALFTSTRARALDEQTGRLPLPVHPVLLVAAAGIEPSTSGFPPFTLPPSDANLAKRINTVAGFVHKNGAKFETVTRTKQSGNTEFAFLTQGGDGYEYYAWLKHANAQGVDPTKPIGMTADDSFDAAKLAEAARKIAEAAAQSSGKGDGDGTAGSGDGTQGGAANEGNKGSGTGNKGNKGTRVGPWQAVKDATGRTYYWNRDTAATTWTPPDGFT